MRAAIYERFGDPAEVLAAAERPLPEPGAGEIRAKLVLSPIHNHDLWTIRGSYGVTPKLPATGGSEAVGIVDAHGPGVTAPPIGARVAVSGAAGAWAEYFTAPAARALPLPDGIDDATACQLVSMPLSALALVEDLGLSAGDWLVQNAANGTVGRLVALFAAARGLNVVGLVRRDAGIDELAARGIGNVVSTAQPDFAARVRALTGGAPIARGIESLGGDGAAQLLAVLADGGRLISFGSMTGEPLSIDASHLIFRAITVEGFWGATRFPALPAAQVGRMIGELVTLAAQGTLRLPVDATFGLDQAGAAAAANARPGRSGKVALRP